MRVIRMAFVVAAAGLAGCAGEEAPPDEIVEEVVLGPQEGHDLPGVDLDRVQVGDEAPDFSLASLAGPVVTLSELRGSRNVVLVFYRGHW